MPIMDDLLGALLSGFVFLSPSLFFNTCLLGGDKFILSASARLLGI